MQVNQLLDHSQTNSHTRLRPVRSRIRLAKDLEDMRQERRIDSLSVIRYCQSDLAIFFFESNNDATAGLCKLH